MPARTSTGGRPSWAGRLRTASSGKTSPPPAWASTAPLIGERWRIGPDVVLEVSCPRIPCATFQGWLEREGWIKRFTRAALPGAFLRVIKPGEIRAADPVEIVHRPGHDVTVALAFRAMTREPELLARLLVADALPEEGKELARRRTTA
jgi:MOSC domain-containing protein YiiM